MIPPGKLLVICAALGVAAVADRASAQTLTLLSPTVNDGGFESIFTKSNYNSPTDTGGTSTIPNWGATLVSTTGAAVAAPNNSGAEQANPAAAGAADNSATHTGAAGGFWQPGGSSTAFNLTATTSTGATYTITANTTYTLTWFARLTGGGGAQAASLFSQLTSTAPGATTGGTYTYQPSATLISVDGTTNTAYALDAGHNFTQYTLSYTSKAADVGKFIGLTFGNSGTAFIGADDFTLTATTAVPEPSTYVTISAGLVGILMCLRRSKRALV